MCSSDLADGAFPMIRWCVGNSEMRVSTGLAASSDNRMFTVVIESFGAGPQRRTARTMTVPFQQLQSLMQTIARKGGRIKVVSSEGVLPAPMAEVSSELPSAPQPPVSKSEVSHAEIPVNLYKPKDPFVGTVTGNYSLLAEGAIGRVNHIT